MKLVSLLVALVAIVVAESPYYETENDYIDVDAILTDPVELQSYIDCYLDRKPCTSLAASYKRHLQDAVIRACDRCNLPQRERFAKALWGLKTFVPQEYINIRQKYDPTGRNFDKLEDVLAKYLHFNTPLYLRYYYYLYKK